MAKNELISVFCFGVEIGRLGFDQNQDKSFFQYNEVYLKSEKYKSIFPDTGILKRINQTQVFSQFAGETFRSLPPMIADSLPDMFGNMVFKEWLEFNNKDLSKISVLEQLAYVGNRGMGALEYIPSKDIPETSEIDLTEIISILKEVLQNKSQTRASKFDSEGLLNVFKIGTSAGGVRPKILISEHKKTGEVSPGDINYSREFNHYLVKLAIDAELGYDREVIEYCYYLIATRLGINIMPSKLIEEKHFATLRYDRQNGSKQHVLTASGLTGWDFKSTKDSSYENLFELALFLKIPHAEIEELFQRMVFNVVFCNTDDHLKNHSFIYNEKEDKWNLAPAYDLTYSLNPLINYNRVSRALSINNKRIDITMKDILLIGDRYTIKNAKKVIEEVLTAVSLWKTQAKRLNIQDLIVERIYSDFNLLESKPR